MTERGAIVYVHGASDRAAQEYDQVGRIERQLAAAHMAFDVIPTRWGELAGADLSHIEDALPLTDSAMQAAALPPQPSAELRRLAATATAAASPLGPAMAERRQSDDLLDICRTQVGKRGETISLAGGESVPMDEACRRAANRVGESNDYAQARN